MKKSLNNKLMQLNDCRFDHRLSLTRAFHLDLAFAKQGEQRALGRCSARISNRNGVTIMFYQQQISDKTQIGRNLGPAHVVPFLTAHSTNPLRKSTNCL